MGGELALFCLKKRAKNGIKRGVKALFFIKKDLGGIQMDDYQRRQIWTLRQLGKGYGTIATALNLPKDSVKKYCGRYPELKGYGQATKQMLEDKIYDYCQHCQMKLDHHPKGRPKKFCSAKCRKDFWLAHSDEHDKSRNAFHELTCHHCGRSFSSYSTADRKFCSHDCYIKSRFYKET